MTRALSPRERRLVALLILVALLALCWFVIVSPIVAGFAERAAARDALSLRYMHDLQTIAAIPRLRRQAEEERAALAPLILRVRGGDDAREWLKSRLQRTVEQSGGEWRDAVDAGAPPGWAGARADARLTEPQLVGVLKALQIGPPWLVVGRLTVVADGAAVPKDPSVLEVQVDVMVPIRAAAT
ncbi:type II secretion system protein GspM [Sphingomonas sp. 8AM]|uniref:type II secretion system protein GspM n=1 Tax=Sphingomonas sp. 8AM TaxID=2653170 RepID=UPI0012F3346D|nr:type II secretion system protein GspM [Sphingomonas sp. 8AM]VXD01446.1 conserved hypothetical protein [Sphingomonas sp. 8AM]